MERTLPSTTEDVVGDDENALTSVGRSAWVGQELLKGTWEIDAIDFWPGLEITSEGGWGINMSYRLNQSYYADGKYKPTVNDFDWTTVVDTPLFTSFVTEADKMRSPERFVPPSDAWHLRAKLLCNAIPATSHAVGMKAIMGVADNRHFAEFINNKLTYPHVSGGVPQWHHSDLKNVSYIFNYGLYDYVLQR